MTRARQIVRSRLTLTLCGLLTAAAVGLAVPPTFTDATAAERQVKPPRQDYNSGAYLYRTFCASCHGEQGGGDGPVSALLIARPPDLTTIAARHGGQFNRPDVHAAIDGRRSVAGHGSTGMPIWGDVLKATEGHDDAIITKRIDALVTHLESLQPK